MAQYPQHYIEFVLMNAFFIVKPKLQIKIIL